MRCFDKLFTEAMEFALNHLNEIDNSYGILRSGRSFLVSAGLREEITHASLASHHV
jgi:hypothetical protein